MAKKIMIYNRKGGVGKSNLAVNMGHYLSKFGRTLIIDIDSQKDSLSYLGLNKEEVEYRLDDLFDRRLNVQVEDALIEVRENLYLITNNQLENVGTFFYQSSRLDKMFSSKLAAIENVMDFIIFDASPNRNKITDSILMYVENLIIPIQMMGGSVRSIANIYSVLNDLFIDTGIIKAVIPTFYDATTNDSKENFKFLKEFFKDTDLRTNVIPRRTKIAESNKMGKSIIDYHPETGMIFNEIFGSVVKRLV